MKDALEMQALMTTNALAYLAKRNALHKLAEPCPIVGRDICLWMPARESSLAFDLPPLSAINKPYGQGGLDR